MSPLTREGALFDLSCLYRQAREGARELVNELEEHPLPFASAVALLAGSRRSDRQLITSHALFRSLSSHSNSESCRSDASFVTGRSFRSEMTRLDVPGGSAAMASLITG